LPRSVSSVEDNAEPELEVSVSRQDGATVVAVAGELDAASTPRLQAPLGEVSEQPAAAVLLDLSGCDFVDSTGLHAIIDARGEIERRGGRFALCCAERGPVARVIEVALPGMLDVHPTREAALQALR
jgi:anti-sigma B factor antagonist